MSYWVTLNGAGPVEHFEDGGTQVLGGSDRAELNITYNYSDVYRLLNFSIGELDKMRAGDWIGELEKLVAKCGTSRWKDYWAPTPGNAGAALALLLKWAKQYPDATFEVS